VILYGFFFVYLLVGWLVVHYAFTSHGMPPVFLFLCMVCYWMLWAPALHN
jgi:hypothetical protein